MTYILILNFNGAYDTIECLQSVFRMHNRAFHAILIDNNSTDSSVDTLENWLYVNETPFNKIRYLSQKNSFSTPVLQKKALMTFIYSDENNGYASGNNIGLKYVMQNASSTDFIWILNNDTIVYTETLYELTKSWNSLQKQNIALLGAKVLEYTYPHNIQSVGIQTGLMLKEEKLFYACHSSSLSYDIEVDSICGCSIFLSLETLKEIGLMPEEYFLYYEETDWMRAIKLKGFKIFTSGNSIVLHKHAKSTGGYLSPMVLYYMTRNRVLFNKKYLTDKKFLLFCIFFSLYTLIKAVIYFFRSKTLSHSILSGMIDGFKGISGKTYQRR
ncbi:MAG: glycosyltransferase family 2 protein [Sulfurimonas sp.]|uniref:glycosyltransferase n=1 Tax=Sulfurimonas sp. TaxID=2022749 RepID=UPI0026199BF9|nr:glycosyltransferase family 2 protein [Sulfurimonas sp.]MDD5371924.1 glycosyltransferase family 2 protein [Sulfurimonas sp.]